jgi:hypothetical protein
MTAVTVSRVIDSTEEVAAAISEGAATYLGVVKRFERPVIRVPGPS